MEDKEKWFSDFCKMENIENDNYLNFTDELKLKELDMKVFKLIEEHCEMGFKEWSSWSGYGYNYPIFIRILQQKEFNRLLKHYRIEPTI